MIFTRASHAYKIVDAVSNPLSAALRSRSRMSMLAIDIVLAKITVNTSNSK
jgi:hypothetical protein